MLVMRFPEPHFGRLLWTGYEALLVASSTSGLNALRRYGMSAVPANEPDIAADIDVSDAQSGTCPEAWNLSLC